MAVKVGAVATPLASVMTVAELLNVPLAPLPGAANVTDAPGTGLLDESRTVAFNAVGNAVLTVVLWGEPAVVVMLAGAPTVLVRAKVAGGVVSPAPVAVTL